jgi:hypothetical protein
MAYGWHIATQLREPMNISHLETVGDNSVTPATVLSRISQQFKLFSELN